MPDSAHQQELIKYVDGQATEETKSLLAFLMNISGDYMLFGHQNDTTERVVPNAKGDSDTYNSVGAYPAVFGVSMTSDTERLTRLIQDLHKKGGIVTLEDHMPNFTTGNSFYDVTPCVAHILPGGEDHAKFLQRLDQTALAAKGAVDSEGAPIPIIYRPFHENSGSWFWWGASSATKEEFTELWHFTIHYLRDTCGVHQFLYAYSPNGHFASEEEYLDRYPGDDYVDILGFDVYDDKPTYDSDWMKKTVKDAEIVVSLGAAKSKVAAITEVGMRWNAEDGLKLDGNTVPDWFTLLHNHLIASEKAKYVAYMMTWRNDNPGMGNPPAHFWVPYRNHPEYGDHEMLSDFIRFYERENVIFADQINTVKDKAMHKSRINITKP